jgi:hypothetical protein
MKLNRKHLRRLIESVILEASTPGYRRNATRRVWNKDKAKAEKVKSQIEKASWNSGYKVKVVKADDPRIGGAGSGGATNRYTYGVEISGFSQQKEADNFATIVKDKTGFKATSIKPDGKAVMVDPS